MNRIFLAAVCGVCWTLVPLPMGHAQSPPKTRLTKTQNSLTAKAFEAYKAGDYDVAVTMFRSSLELGEANITHLHLGRALFRAGKCDEAVAAYDAVTKAPQVTMPRPADVLGKLAEYRTEVETGCPGTVTFDCTPTSMLVSVDGESERGCEGLTLSLPTGSYVATSEVLGQKVEVPFQVTGTREHRVALKVSARDLIGAALAADAPRDRLPLLSLAAELENPAQAWLLLAQAQADLGQCALALDALDRIEGASSTPEMSPSAARTEREILAGKLARTCYGTLLPQCTMEGMHVQIDDGERVPCDGTATRVVVGSRRVSGLLGDRSVTVQVEVVSGTEQPVTLMLDGDATEGGGTPWAWVTLGASLRSRPGPPTTPLC